MSDLAFSYDGCVAASMWFREGVSVSIYNIGFSIWTLKIIHPSTFCHRLSSSGWQEAAEVNQLNTDHA